jgi:hypothetical protein
MTKSAGSEMLLKHNPDPDTGSSSVNMHSKSHEAAKSPLPARSWQSAVRAAEAQFATIVV